MYPAFVVTFDVPLPDDANPAGAAAASAAEGPTPKRARVAAGAAPFTFGAPCASGAAITPFAFGAAPPSPPLPPFTFGAPPAPAAGSLPGFFPGDLTVGEKVYWIGDTLPYIGGEVTNGQEGEVTNVRTVGHSYQVEVMFPGNKGACHFQGGIDCLPRDLSREPP